MSDIDDDSLLVTLEKEPNKPLGGVQLVESSADAGVCCGERSARIYVAAVKPTSIAFDALDPGMEILSVNGEPAESIPQVADAVRLASPRLQLRVRPSQRSQQWRRRLVIVGILLVFALAVPLGSSAAHGQNRADKAAAGRVSQLEREKKASSAQQSILKRQTTKLRRHIMALHIANETASVQAAEARAELNDLTAQRRAERRRRDELEVELHAEKKKVTAAETALAAERLALQQLREQQAMAVAASPWAIASLLLVFVGWLKRDLLLKT